MTQHLFTAMRESIKATVAKCKPISCKQIVVPRIRQIAPSPHSFLFLQILFSASSPKAQIGELLPMKEHAIGCKCLETRQPIPQSASQHIVRLVSSEATPLDWEIPRTEDRQFRVDRVISYLNK